MSFSTKIIVTVLAAAGAFFANPALAKYPENTIRMIVPTGASSGADVTARFFARRVQEALGSSIIVDGFLEDEGAKAIAELKGATADGYTLLLTNSLPVVTNVALAKDLPYDPQKDLTPLVKLSYNPMGVVVPRSSSVETVEQLVEQAKKASTPLNYGSVTPSAQVATELFVKQADIKATSVTYGDASAALKDLDAQKIDFMFIDTDALMALASTHPLRVIATTADKRYKHAPDAPTLQELGYKDFYMVDWLGVYGPAGMSAETQKEVSEALLKIYDEKRSKNYLERSSWEVFSGDYQELEAFQKEELNRWTEAVKQSSLVK